MLDRDADRATVARGLGRIPAIDYVLVPSGAFDLIGELVCRDGDELLETLTKDVGAVEGIAQVETFRSSSSSTKHRGSLRRRALNRAANRA